jgi:glycosyltransferase involved in cell wall biosynthesis
VTAAYAIGSGTEEPISLSRDVRLPKSTQALTLPLPKVSLVIPTLNEADNLRWLLPRLPSWVFEVLIVDGCSADGTVQVARSILPEARVLIEKRRGKGVALMTGFEAAAGDIIVMLDADGSMDPEEIILFVVALMAGADFVKGSRFIQGAGTTDMTRIRMLGNWALTRAFRMLYGGSFSDLCYGYIGFWRRCVPLLRSSCVGFEVETVLNIKALQNGLKVVEVASFESDRIHGESNLRTLPDGWRILKTILRERFARKSSPWGLSSPSNTLDQSLGATESHRF